MWSTCTIPYNVTKSVYQVVQSLATVQHSSTNLHLLHVLALPPCPISSFCSFLYRLSAVFAIMAYAIPLQCCLISCCLLTCCCCCLCCCCCCGLLLPKDDSEYDYYAYEDLVREEGEPIATQPRGTGGAYNGTGDTEAKTPIQYAPLLLNPAHRSVSAYSVY